MNHIRHSGIFDASDLNISLVGAGGIGAMTALALAKMGVNILTVYDDDVVSEENMPTQLHRLETDGQSKVYGLRQTLAMFSDDTFVDPIPARIEEDAELYGNIVISAVDSISARKAIWQAVNNGRAQWYLDARMAAEEFHLYCVDLSQDTSWYDQIISREQDGNVADIPCTAKATFFTACIAAGQIGSAVRKIATGIAPARYLVHNILGDTMLAIKG